MYVVYSSFASVHEEPVSVLSDHFEVLGEDEVEVVIFIE